VASHWLQVGAIVGNTSGNNIVNAQDIATNASNWLSTLPAGGGAGDSVGISGVAQSVAADSSTALASPAGDALSSGAGTTVTSSVSASPVLLPSPTTPSFTSPQPVDHTAAYIGRLDLTKSAAPIDSLMSQQASDGGLGHWAWSAAARQSDKSSMSSSNLHDSISVAATVTEPLASSVDEDLLDTLAAGRRFNTI
jgi:hypothetical protein